jgi:alkylation response protein AidB-like acyl-CoA dehydrogenase
MQENVDLIRSAVQEFCTKKVAGISTEIEREGIQEDLIKELGLQGFLGSMIPQENGGSGLDIPSFMVMLNTVASFSPSVAVKLLINNTVVNWAVLRTRKEKLPELAEGSVAGTLNTPGIFSPGSTSPSIVLKGDRLTGTIKNLMSPNSSIVISDLGNGDLAVIYSGTRVKSLEKPLAFRGLRSGEIEIDTGDFDIIPHWKEEFASVMRAAVDQGVASIALGISRGALNKVADYVSVRKTFDHELKDYSPVASQITGLLSELSIMEFYLENMEDMDESSGLMIKIRSTDFAKRAAKAAIQYHGGYGYFEDFGVEKFYRDSYGLSAMLMDRHEDGMRLNKKIFGSRSGYI